MRVPPPQPVILTAISTFQRRAPTHFYQHPQMEKIATSVITRMYVEVGSALSAEMRLGQPCMSGDRRREANNHAAFRK
jgi:hypothetical protein